VSTREVIEWPRTGSRQWWIVDRGPGGLLPVEGTFPTRAAAESRLAELGDAPGRPAAPCTGACPSCPGRGGVR
jgi:hypothetical protein